MFDFDMDEGLRALLRKLARKDPVLREAVFKKVSEIIFRNKQTIAVYKNLRHDLHQYKRVHITAQYVLIFSVDTTQNMIHFIELGHRDSVYKKKS